MAATIRLSGSISAAPSSHSNCQSERRAGPPRANASGSDGPRNARPRSPDEPHDKWEASMNRRELLVGGAAVSAAALASVGQMFAQGGSAVFNGAGGSWQDNARRAWLEPFEKATGTKVVDTSPFDIGKLSTMVRMRTVSWDLTDCPAVFVPLAMKNDLLDPIDYAVVDKEALPPENYGTHAVAYSVFTSNIVYDGRKLMGENVPKSWRDFWDLKRFPGPRAMRNQPLAALEAALLADGVPAARL